MGLFTALIVRDLARHDARKAVRKAAKKNRKQATREREHRNRNLAAMAECAELSAQAVAAERERIAAQKAEEEAARDAEIEATLCQDHYPPEHDLNPSFRYRADLCPECHPEPEPEIDFPQIVDVATALLAGGESNSDVAAYISGETGIPQAEALRILLGIKGKLAVKAETE